MVNPELKLDKIQERGGDPLAGERPSMEAKRGALSWALPLTCTVMFYGLAGGIWKQSALGYGQFCVLFVAVKTLTNLGVWGVASRRNPMIPEGRTFLKWAMFGQLFNGMAWICYFKALSLGPAALVQTITASYTALTVILALIFLKERLIPLQMAGIGLVIGAAVTLGYSSGHGSAGEHGMAWFWASLGTLFCWGVCTAIFKHAYNQPGADDYVFFLTNWVGMGITVLPFGWTQMTDANWSNGLGLGLVIVLFYCIGDLTLFAAINRGPAALVSPLSGLYPLPTIAYSALVLKETITGLQWGAVAVVLVAMMMVFPADENPIIRLIRGQKEES